MEVPNFRLACATCHTNLSGKLKAPCLYRSGELALISDKNAILIKELGIDCNIDLRSCQEIEKKYPDKIIKNGVYWKHFPLKTKNEIINKIFPDFKDYSYYYCDLLERNKDIIVSLFYFIATSEFKRIIVSCYAGKDRTGIIIFLIMIVLGVDKELIIEDFVLSKKFLAKDIEYFKENWKKRGINKEEYLKRINPDHKTLREVINYLNSNYGSSILYLNKIGVPENIFTKIRKKFSSYTSKL